MNRECSDVNPKTIKRIYDWNGKQVQIDLCEEHRKDPDFSYFVSEEKI